MCDKQTSDNMGDKQTSKTSITLSSPVVKPKFVHNEGLGQFKRGGTRRSLREEKAKEIPEGDESISNKPTNKSSHTTKMNIEINTQVIVPEKIDIAEEPFKREPTRRSLRQLSKDPQSSDVSKTAFCENFTPAVQQMQQIFGKDPTKKVTLQQIRKESILPETDSICELKDVPVMMVKRILQTDYTCRDEKFLKDTSTSDQASGEETVFHPLDVLMVVYISCGPMLQQVIAQKMFLCQLAVPLIVPSKESPELLLWPLRNVTLSWRNSQNQAMHASLASHSTKIVSVIRYDCIQFTSKSELLNNILSVRDVFFHRDCMDGNCTKIISDGMVEMAWYLPSGKSSDKFSDELLFLNLRGDAHTCETQVSLLFEISSVVIIMVDADKLLKCLPKVELQSSHNIIMVITHNIDLTLDKHLKTETYKDILDQYSLKSRVFSFTGKSTDSGVISRVKSKINRSANIKTAENIADEVCSKIGAYIKKQTSKESKLESLSTSCQQVGIGVDENHTDLKKGINEANTILRRVNVEPLTEPDAAIQTKPKLEELLDKVVKQYDTLNDDTCRIFIKQLELTLKERTLEAFRMIKQHRPIQNLFGFENIFREMGVLYYKCLEGQDKYRKEDIINKLPHLVAKEVLKGNPCQLLDGRTSHVPTKWIRAVMTSMQQLVGDKKICTLAIVGVQTSGKSSLLNAMFGLDLPVSSGRCTSGVYAQLIEVDHNFAPDLDYIMILDSEGLRGPRNSDKNFEYDHKLSTFIIGLADLALVNLIGENAFEKEDIIKTVVHAFVRLKIKDPHKVRKALFVFQNIATPDAMEKLRSSRYKMGKMLNELTAKLGIYEDEDLLTDFRQALDFDLENDVFYTSSLLIGNPPMARVNPEYVDGISQVKTVALEKIKDCSYTSFESMHTLLDVLWDAIVSDNFEHLRNFRNQQVERNCGKLDEETPLYINNMIFRLTEFVKRIVTMQIETCDSIQILNNGFEQMCNTVEKEMDKLLLEANLLVKKCVCYAKDPITVNWGAEKEKLVHKKAKAKYRMLLNDMTALKVTKSIELDKTNFVESSPIDIRRDMNNIFRDHFSSSLAPQNFQNSETIVGTIKRREIEEEHYEVQKDNEQDSSQLRDRVFDHVNSIFKDTDVCIKTIIGRKVPISTSDWEELLAVIDASFMEQNSNYSQRKIYELTDKLRQKIVSHVFGYALRKFITSL